MTTQEEAALKKGTLAEILDRIAALGDVPPERIRMSPPPGQATEAHVLAALAGPDKRLCELVDGVLVEKPMSTPESFIAMEIVFLIKAHIRPGNLGAVFGEGGMLRLTEGLIRIPDVSFVPWEKIPGRRIDMNQPVAELVPDLAIEVLSKKNTPTEIDRKLKDYFFHGARLAWVIDPRKQTAKSYSSPESFQRIGKAGVLDGAPVLPGFRVSLPELFSTAHG